MNITAKHIYWTSTKPRFYMAGNQTSAPGQSFAIIVIIGDGTMFEARTLVDELRTICPDAPPDDIVMGRVLKESAFRGQFAVHYSTLLQKKTYAGWESVESEPDFL